MNDAAKKVLSEMSEKMGPHLLDYTIRLKQCGYNDATIDYIITIWMKYVLSYQEENKLNIDNLDSYLTTGFEDFLENNEELKCALDAYNDVAKNIYS